MTSILQHIVHKVLCGSTGNGHQHTPQVHQNQTQIKLPATVGPGGSAGLSDQQGLSDSTVLRFCQGSRWQPRPQASAWLSMIAEAMEINTEPVCDRVKDPDMDPSSSSGPDGSVALGSSTEHPGLHGYGSSLTLRFHPRPHASAHGGIFLMEVSSSQ